MLNRFQSADVGREILARASELKIQLHRGRGRMLCTYELSGCIGSDPFDDDDDDDEGDLLTEDRKAEARREADVRDMAFVVDLLREFKKVQQ